MTNSTPIIIHAAWIITCEEQNSILENHALVIKDHQIEAILPSNKIADHYPDVKEEHHYRTHAVLPGFINAHTHLAMNLFRGLADDLPLMDWLTQYIWPAEQKWVSPEFVYDASLLAMAEMIRSGTVCFNDMYFFLHDTARAATEAGLRAHIGMTVIDVPTAWATTTDEYLAKALDFYAAYKNHALITPTLAPHSTYTVSIENLIKVNQLARDLHLKINIHLQEADPEVQVSLQKFKKRPLQRLYEIDMVSPDLIAIHMTQLNERDFEIINEKKPNIIHCPESNMKLASGACPVERLMQAGTNVALGTDGAASNNDLDMITEMRSAAFLGKLTASDTRAVTAEAALKMATLYGAKALGIDHLTGSLTKGKSADFIAINLEEIETQPVYHPISQIVYAASRQQVTDVWVAGKQLLKNRKLLTLDEKEIRQRAVTWRNKIKNQV